MDEKRLRPSSAEQQTVGLVWGSTFFDFLVELRDSVHEPPRRSAENRGYSTKLPRTFRLLPRTFHGFPWNAAARSGIPWGRMSLAITQATAIPMAMPTTMRRKHPRPAAATIERPRNNRRKHPQTSVGIPPETSTDALTLTRGFTHRNIQGHPRKYPPTPADIHAENVYGHQRISADTRGHTQESVHKRPRTPNRPRTPGSIPMETSTDPRVSTQTSTTTRGLNHGNVNGHQRT